MKKVDMELIRKEMGIVGFSEKIGSSVSFGSQVLSGHKKMNMRHFLIVVEEMEKKGIEIGELLK